MARIRGSIQGHEVREVGKFSSCDVQQWDMQNQRVCIRLGYVNR